MDYEKKFLLGDLVKGRRTFNNEIVEGKFTGFQLHNNLDPTSVIGVIYVEGDRCYDVVVESIELLESEDEKIRKMPIQYFSDDDSTNGISNSSIRAWLEKQDEQKPDDYLKWDELTWEDINTLEGLINNVHYEFRNGIGEESFGKEVLERFREIKGDEYMDSYEQKPTWSEEDEEKFRDVIRLVKQGAPVQSIRDHYTNWLKSLKDRIQPK